MDFHPGTSVGVVSNIKSAPLCQKECQKVPACKMFVWGAPYIAEAQFRHKCFFKDAEMDLTKMIEKVGVISGPKECGR